MAKLGVVAAARAVGHSRATIWRYVKRGKLSASVDGGAHHIDSAELERVFGPLPPYPVARQPSPATVAATTATDAATLRQLHERIAALEHDNAELRAAREHDQAQHRRDLAAEREERQRLLGIVEQAQRLLTDQRSTTPAPTTTRPKAPHPPRRRRARRRAPASHPTRPAPAPSFTDFVAGLLRPR